MDILIADDEPSICEPIGEVLRSRGHIVTLAFDGAEALSYLTSQIFDLVVTDVRLPKVDGFSILRRVRADAHGTEVVLITAYASVSDAVKAMKQEAFDYLAKPFDTEQLLIVVDRVADRKQLLTELQHARAQLATIDASRELVGRSPPIVHVRERLAAIAESDAPVLITGESGTGKELIARMVHASSQRRDRPFLATNCAALPEALLEAELFGHLRGAFTGAIRSRQGRFAAAHGGTLFLDEIAELSVSAQAKLLRVIQEGTFERIGTNTPVPVDVRIICATNQELKRQIAEGRFREDLYYRIKVLEVLMPPLRNRKSDLPLLVETLLRRHARPGLDPPQISPRAWAALIQYDYPGNVRELEHAIEQALVLSRGNSIDLGHLPTEIRGPQMPGEVQSTREPLNIALQRFERECIVRALVDAQGSRARTAELLGTSRTNLWKKMREYGITDAEIDQDPELDS